MSKVKRYSTILIAIMLTVCSLHLPIEAISKYTKYDTPIGPEMIVQKLIESKTDVTVTTGAMTGYSVNISNPDGHNEWNANYPQILIDGEIGFCLQPGYILAEGPGFNPTPYEAHEVSIIAYEGWIRSNHTSEDYLATQFMIWEFLGGRITSTSFGNYGAYKTAIQEKVIRHNTLASFNNASITLNVGESKTLTDTNGVFNQFHLVSNGGLNISQNGNSLTITGTMDAPDKARVIYNKVPDNCIGVSMAYTKPGSQTVGKLFVDDPLPTMINVKVNKYGSLSITKQDEDGTKVPGTSFTVSKNADMSSPVGSYTTGGDGSVKVNELLPGTYHVQETAVPSHLVLDSTVRSVTINANQTTDFNAQNNWVKGKIKLKKTDKESGKQIANAVYAIYNQQNQELERLITTATGYVESGYLRFGQYSVKEVIAPEGYVLSDTVYPVIVSSNEQKIEVTGVNERVRGSINLTKEDSVTGSTAQGEGTLEGAVYGLYARNDIKDPADASIIYSAGDKIAELKTDKEAKASITDLYLGDYYLRELTPSNGYTLDETEYDVSITYEGQTVPVVIRNQTVKERVIAQAFSIIKVSSDDTGEAENLEGAEFTIKSEKDIAAHGSWEAAPIAKNADGKEAAVLVTDKNGQAISEELPYGTYVIRETKTPDDKYPVADFEVIVNEDSREPQPWRVFNDKSFKSVLKIVKKDAETGKTVLLPNASFKVKNLDTDEYVSQWVWFPFPHAQTIWKTEKDGTVYTNDVLPVASYQLEEITAPNGYVINKEPVKFRIDSKQAYQVLPDGKTPVITVELSDVSVKGKITVSKEGDVLVSAEKQKNDSYKFVYETRKLKDAVFDVYASEDIYTADHQGDLIYKKDTLVETIKTGKDGTASTKALPLGSYYVKEKTAPEGFTHSDEILETELKYKDQNTAIVFSDAGTYENDRQKVKVSAEKHDAETKEALSGAEISLYANRNVYNYDGTVILKAGEKIETAVTDKEGKANFSADLPNDLTPEYAVDPLQDVLDPEFSQTIIDDIKHIGDTNALFYLTESKAPAGYASGMQTRYHFDTKYTDQSEVELEFAYDFQNPPTKTEISKVDITDQQELPGASLQIKDSTGSIIESWISTDKPHMIERLSFGEYTLIETIPADGYVTALDIKFSVTDTMEIQKVKMVDDITKLQIVKTDENGDMLKGNTLTVYDGENKLDEWVSTDQPHDITKLTVGKTYTLKELKAADGYSKAPDVDFTVRNTPEIQVVNMNNKLTEMTFSKVDESLKELPGAKLQVIEKESGKVFDEWISTDKVHKITGLTDSKEYIMKEISAPYGYEIAEEIVFTATDKQTIVMKDKMIRSYIKVNKVDADDLSDILKEAEFTLYKDAECKEAVAAEKTGTADGIAVFNNLIYGTYYIKETKAPAGYALSDEVIKVTIDDEWVHGDDKLRTIVFPDTPLPGGMVTGDQTQITSVIGIMITSGLAAGLLLKRKKKYKKQ